MGQRLLSNPLKRLWGDRGLQPILYDVARDDPSGETNVTIDMSAARVVDASDLKIGSLGSVSGSNVVTGENSKWYRLGLIRVSAGVQTFKQKLKKVR